MQASFHIMAHPDTTHPATPAQDAGTHRSPDIMIDTPLRPANSALRFTEDGDAELEQHLADTCEAIARGLKGLLPAKRLEAVLLGGGYGRGEGGVLKSPEGDRPYNDLEFYVFLLGSRHLNERRHGRALHTFGEIMTPQAGVEVEFRIASLSELVSEPVSMFSYDLISGHRWLIGDETLLKRCARHRISENIPLSEATRLLMNRCTGLLLARERLERPAFTPADADFVARNVAKAQLGAGDAVLTAFGHYHWSVHQRHRRLERLVRRERAAWLNEVYRHHARGIAFKLHPVRSTASRTELAVLHAEVTAFCRDAWLWVENRRLGARFWSIRDYAACRKDKWPEKHRLRNLLVTGKVLGIGAIARKGRFRHPRNRVLAALPILLWQPEMLGSQETITRLQEELHTGARDSNGLVAAYRELWRKVN